MYGGGNTFEPVNRRELTNEDPVKLAQKLIAHIDKKRAALGIDKKRERVLFDMAMRRDLGAGAGIGDVGCTGPQHLS